MKIIYTDKNGNTLTDADLSEPTTPKNRQVLKSGDIDPKARKLHEEGRELGGAYDFDRAILKFKEAINIQPDWAYPIYDMAFSYLRKGDDDLALGFFKKADELEPDGFFETKEVIYTLEGEKEGKFPKGLYMYYKQIEMRPGLSQQQKLDIATEITQNAPAFAPGWLALQSLLADSHQRLYAVEQGLSKNPDETTKGYLLFNKALILTASARKDEAIQLLGECILSPESIATNIVLAKMTFQMIIEQSKEEITTISP
jgi:tetratricopeptide (TPR) repeat protein